MSISDAVVLKLDRGGNRTWRYNVTDDSTSDVAVEFAPSDILLKDDGDLVVAMNLGMLPFLQNMTIPYLLALDRDGTPVMATYPGPSANPLSYVTGLEELSDGTILSSGLTWGHTGAVGLLWGTRMTSPTDVGTVQFVSLADADIQFNGVVSRDDDLSIAVGSLDNDTEPMRSFGVLFNLDTPIDMSVTNVFWSLPNDDLETEAYDVTLLQSGAIAIVGSRDSGYGLDGFVTLVDPSSMTSVDTDFIVADGGGGNVIARAVDVAPNGDLVVVGVAQGPIEPDDTSNGETAFVAIYDTTDDTLTRKDSWLIDAQGNDFAFDVAVSDEGIILVTGYTHGSLDGTANGGGMDAYVRAFAP